MKFRSLPLSIKLDDSAAGNSQTVPPDVQIMRVGTFYSDEHGKLAVTSEMLKNMVKNFNERVRGVDLAIDYKHDSDDVAAGWIKQLYLMNESTELWAKVDWTPKGSKVLTDKEFRYLSADFHLDFKHNETNKTHGPTLFGAGLTNRPFIKEMDPVIELSETKGSKKMDEKDKQIADLQAQIVALKKQIEDDGKEEGDNDKPEMADMKQQNADLKKKVADYEASAAEAGKAKALAEKKSAFDKLFTEGKVVEAQREHYMAGDTIKFAENAGKPNMSGSGSSNDTPIPPAVKDSSEAQDQIIKLAEKAVVDKRAKDIGSAQALVLSENPELKKKIYG